MIRKAQTKDIEAIAAFQLAMAMETENLELNQDTVLKGVKAVIDDPSKGFYIVSEENNKVVASLMITLEWSDWRAQTIWWIQSLYVISEWRQKGIYKSMYLYLREMVLNNSSIGGIRLYVDKTNTTAQKVYEALGMDGEHYHFYEDMK
jgi:ribosomal protein S18 acetylase RimI-like enzyme